jgi:hypothetical protein
MAKSSGIESAFGWLFRNRDNGRITIAQFPNVPLGVFLGATALDRTAALLWWAVDEILRGVNPWRRFLGGAVLAAQILSWATS